MRLPWRRAVPDDHEPPFTVPDDLPRRDLFTEPLTVDRITVADPEPLDADTWRVTFGVRVRDAAGKRCPDIAVEARISGPTRAATGQATTDLMGRIRFRMEGPPGTYDLEVVDVAAGGLVWDRDAGATTATCTVAPA